MKTASISGFGGSYEWGCQRMLELGLAWIKEHPTFDFQGQYHGFKNVYGVLVTDTDVGKELDTAMMNDPVLKEFGVTGAMHQAVVGHLAYIHKNGREAWLKELAKHREPEDFFEYDATDMGSVPSTELSRKMDAGKGDSQ